MRTKQVLPTIGLAGIGALLGAGCSDSSDDNVVADFPLTLTLTLTNIASKSAGTDNNPEIVRFLPGTTDKAIFIASGVNKLGTIQYNDAGFTIDGLSAVPASQYDSTGQFSVLTSIDVDATGTYVAITRVDTRCPSQANSNETLTPGSVLIVEAAPPHGVVGEVEVGYAPDSVSFSADGHWLVVGNEADPERSGEDANACSEPNEGSISIIDLSNGVDSAEVVQELTGFTADEQLPEGVKIAPNNDTVVVTFQPSDEVGIFSLLDVPLATMTIVQLPEDSGPDGLAVSADSSFMVSSNEKGDGFSIITLPGGSIESTYLIKGSGDVPESYNRDARKSTKNHEPEECALFEDNGSTYVALALQESHAVIIYNLDDLSSPVFETIAPVGIDWEAEKDGRENSNIGPEGLAEKDGFIFVANEREGSLTLLKVE